MCGIVGMGLRCKKMAKEGRGGCEPPVLGKHTQKKGKPISL